MLQNPTAGSMTAQEGASSLIFGLSQDSWERQNWYPERGRWATAEQHSRKSTGCMAAGPDSLEHSLSDVS